MTRSLLLLWVGLTAFALAAPLFASDDNGATKTQAAIRLNSTGTVDVYSTSRAVHSKNRREYKIEFKLVEVQEETDVSALAIKVHPVRNPVDAYVRKRLQALFDVKPANKRDQELMRRLSFDLTGHSFSGLSCMRCHVTPQHANSASYFWKTFARQPSALQTWVGNTKGVKVLALPKLTVDAEQVGTVNVKSPRKLQYFRKLKNGVYSLEQEEVTTGITVKAAVQEAGERKIRLKPLSVSVTAVKGREPLDGVKLDVGKPILTTTSISTSVVGEVGKSSVISIDSPRGGRVLISVKVTPVGKATPAKGKAGPPPPVNKKPPTKR